jgi:hypothetical protein
VSYDNYNFAFRRNKITEPSQLTSDADLWTPTSDQKYMLGCIFDTNDGRRFRYQRDSGSGQNIAEVSQSAAGTAGWQDEIQTNNPSLPTAGDKEVTVTMTTTATAGQLIGGYLTVEQGTGLHNMYVIKNNKAGTANATSGWDVKIEIADQGGIRTAKPWCSRRTRRGPLRGCVWLL